jgi:hypothetical protein
LTSNKLVRWSLGEETWISLLLSNLLMSQKSYIDLMISLQPTEGLEVLYVIEQYLSFVD